MHKRLVSGVIFFCFVMVPLFAHAERLYSIFLDDYTMSISGGPNCTSTKITNRSPFLALVYSFYIAEKTNCPDGGFSLNKSWNSKTGGKLILLRYLKKGNSFEEYENRNAKWPAEESPVSLGDMTVKISPKDPGRTLKVGAFVLKHSIGNLKFTQNDWLYSVSVRSKLILHMNGEDSHVYRVKLTKSVTPVTDIKYIYPDELTSTGGITSSTGLPDLIIKSNTTKDVTPNIPSVGVYIYDVTVDSVEDITGKQVPAKSSKLYQGYAPSTGEIQRNAASNSKLSSFCHTWTKPLTIDDKGADVEALSQALVKEGIPGAKVHSVFDEELASWLVVFQEKYPSEILTPYHWRLGTGFLGASTRTKLNKLYGCGNQNASKVQ